MKSLLPTFAKTTVWAGLALLLAAGTPLAARHAAPDSDDETGVSAPAADTAPEAPAAPSAAPATDPERAAEATAPAASAPAVAPAAPAAPAPVWIERGEVVVVGSDVVIAANERASQIVVIGGDIDIRGRVDGEVVAIFGDITIDGPVGQAVAVLGDLTLGANARINGQAVAVVGDLDNPHQAPIKGDVVAFGSFIPHPKFNSFLAWAGDAASHTRLLSPHVAWPWGLFGAGVVFLLLLALVFGRGLNACARSLEERPAMTLTTALALLPLLPLFTVLLVCTIVGVLLVPLLAVAVLFAYVFGKAAVLVFLGRAVLRLGGSAALAERAWLTLLVGGVVLALLYCVPVLSLLVWALSGWVGLGMVAAALLEKRRAEKAKDAAAKAAAVPPAATPAVPAAPVAPAAPASTVAPAKAAEAMPFVMPAVAPATATTSVLPETPVAAAPAAATANSAPEHATPAGAATGAAAEPATAAPVGALPPLPPPPPLAPASEPLLATLPRAEFGIRLLALLIDIVLVAVGGGVSMVLHLVPFPLLFGLYVFAFWFWKGTTIGGIVFNLKVARLDGRPVDAATAVVRTLVAFLSAVTLVGFLWCLWDEERQTWHDKVAGTTVVRVPKATPLV